MNGRASKTLRRLAVAVAPHPSKIAERYKALKRDYTRMPAPAKAIVRREAEILVGRAPKLVARRIATKLAGLRAA